MKRHWHFGLWALLLSVFTVAACSRRLSPEPSCNFVQNPDLQRVSWNFETPVRLYFHKSMPLDTYPEMQSVIREVVDEWNQAVGREILRIEAFNVAGSDVPSKDGYSTVYWMNNWESGKSLEQARTTIYWSGAQIYEADVKINAKDHTYYVGHEESFTGVDFKSLLIHELGHVLGLAHNPTAQSVMNVSLNNGVDRRALGKIDLESIKCEY